MDRRLYMPEIGFTEAYAKRCQQCAVPEDLRFQTKNQLASDMLQAVAASGHFPFRWIGCDLERTGKYADECAVPGDDHA